MRNTKAKLLRKAVKASPKGGDPINDPREYQKQYFTVVTREGKIAQRMVLRNAPTSARGKYLKFKKISKQGGLS